VSALWKDFRSWLRWHRPITRESALRFAEQEADTYYTVLHAKFTKLEANLNFLVKALEDVPELVRLRELTAEPEPKPPSQRDIDDAVAELIRSARRDFGSAR
jgi:hypothetical protein